MISKLTGIVDSVRGGLVTIDVGGVGYGIHTPNSSTMAPGQTLSMWVETVVREDSITLYGFKTEAEHDLFNLLNTVQGIGPKAALSILSALPSMKIVSAIAAGDAKTLSSAPGIGAKTAARISSELKDKIAKAGIALNLADIRTGAKGTPTSRLTEDALSALANLGYSRTQAFEAVVKTTSHNPNIDLDALIRAALKELGSF